MDPSRLVRLTREKHRAVTLCSSGRGGFTRVKDKINLLLDLRRNDPQANKDTHSKARQIEWKILFVVGC